MTFALPRDVREKVLTFYCDVLGGRLTKTNRNGIFYASATTSTWSSPTEMSPR
jgi:hypothetical protein